MNCRRTKVLRVPGGFAAGCLVHGALPSAKTMTAARERYKEHAEQIWRDRTRAAGFGNGRGVEIPAETPLHRLAKPDAADEPRDA